MLAPSLQLNPEYVDLLVEEGFPFSVVPDNATVTRDDFFRIMRDTYQGTVFDLSRQPASGPFGGTDRYDGSNGCSVGTGRAEEDGAFERPIGVYRMAYSFVGEPAAGGVVGRVGEGSMAKKETKKEEEEQEEQKEQKEQEQEQVVLPWCHMLYFAPHCSQTSVYLPVAVGLPPSNSSEGTKEQQQQHLVVPDVLGRGTVKEIDRSSAYW